MKVETPVKLPPGWRRVKVGERLLPGRDRFFVTKGGKNEAAKRPLAKDTPEDRIIAREYASGFYIRKIEDATPEELSTLNAPREYRPLIQGQYSPYPEDEI